MLLWLNEILCCPSFGGIDQVMAPNQGQVCENDISGVDDVSGGSEDEDQEQFTEENATGSCNGYACPC